MDSTLIEARLDADGRVVLAPVEGLPPEARKQAEQLLREAAGLHLYLSRDRAGRLSLRSGVTEDADAEMLSLARGSMAFWDNPVDDAVWNNA